MLSVQKRRGTKRVDSMNAVRTEKKRHEESGQHECCPYRKEEVRREWTA